jgi:hypothetical protein
MRKVERVCDLQCGFDTLGGGDGDNTLNTTSRHTGKNTSCRGELSILIGEEVSDRVEGKEPHTSLEGSADDKC